MFPPPPQELVGVSATSVATLLALGVCEWLHRRRRVSAEVTRKIAHMSSGASAVALGWIATSHWTVLAIIGAFCGLMVATKRWGWLPSIHGVERRTAGAWLYPLAVWACHALSAGDDALFAIAITTLALSDTAAAAVGRRSPLARYHVHDGAYRSAGGSLALFGATFLIILAGLALRGSIDLPGLLVTALVVSLAATATEGISVRGWDNFLLPYMVLALLLALDGASRALLGQWMLGATAAAALLLATAPLAHPRTAGAMAVFLCGLLAWGMGGPGWFLLLAVPWLGFAATRRSAGARHRADLTTLAPYLGASAAVLMLHVHVDEPALFLPLAATVAAIAAITTGRHLVRRGAGAFAAWSARAAAAGGIAAIAGAVDSGGSLTLGDQVALTACGVAASALQDLAARPLGRWSSIGAGAAGAAAWLLV